ncbi:peptidoglycan DD-metalloendopeptidase family protein [Luteibacter aegosomatissinici]|uniref:peptidoglycan DD-metalloendopeptidase family protein n=1 Tax=Luteibacter aegosomatissinici TaxID=2911539 RepID=UPI001FF85AAB|nr:peptidoglycan DD-metalloendopeptidase family protein [Luteibacter aegosomatissinici]UPG93146.1 peptidoglycan DD-metalloendopeptidase family protein [Luteibacter aegosomatissinici]
MRTLRPLALAAAAGMVLLAAGCSDLDPTRHTVVVTRPAGYASPSPHAATPTPPPPGGTYRVVKGDTLYSIAFRNKVDFRDLASWNNVDSSYTIWPGQDLRLSPPDQGRVASSAPAPSHAAPVVAAVPPPAHPASTPSATAPSPQPGFQSVTEAESAPAPATTTNTPVVVAGKPAESVVPSPTAAAAAAATPSAPPPPVENPPASTPIIASGATRNAGGITWRWPADGTLIKRFASGDAIPGIEIGGKSGDPVRAAADGVVVYSGNGLVGYGELVIIKHSDSFLSAYGHNRKRLVKEGEKVKAGQTVAEMGSSGATRDELQFQIRRDGNPVDPLQFLPAK